MLSLVAYYSLAVHSLKDCFLKTFLKEFKKGTEGGKKEKNVVLSCCLWGEDQIGLAAFGPPRSFLLVFVGFNSGSGFSVR